MIGCEQKSSLLLRGGCACTPLVRIFENLRLFLEVIRIADRPRACTSRCQVKYCHPYYGIPLSTRLYMSPCQTSFSEHHVAGQTIASRGCVHCTIVCRFSRHLAPSRACRGAGTIIFNIYLPKPGMVVPPTVLPSRIRSRTMVVAAGLCAQGYRAGTAMFTGFMPEETRLSGERGIAIFHIAAIKAGSSADSTRRML